MYFLRSIGQVGNAIRTGYQASTGAIGRTWSTITKSIGKGFSKISLKVQEIFGKDISQWCKKFI